MPMNIRHKRLLHVGFNERQATAVEAAIDGAPTLPALMAANFTERQARALMVSPLTVKHLLKSGFNRPQALLIDALDI